MSEGFILFFDETISVSALRSGLELAASSGFLPASGKTTIDG